MEIKVYIHQILKGNGKFCSIKCSSDYLRNNPEFKQRMIAFWKANPDKTQHGKPSPKRGKKSPKTTGDKHPQWRGGRHITKDRYIKILKKDHPRADCYGYVLRSHVIVEEKIGRLLKPEEIVHHINRDRTDDRPENLEVLENRSAHLKLHWKTNDFRQ